MFAAPYLLKEMDDRQGYTVRRARKALVRAFINKYKFLHEDQNVFHGGKVFVINSVVGWCLDQRAAKKISLTQMQYYVSLIQRYANDELELSIQEGKLHIEIKE